MSEERKEAAGPVTDAQKLTEFLSAMEFLHKAKLCAGWDGLAQRLKEVTCIKRAGSRALH